MVAIVESVSSAASPLPPSRVIPAAFAASARSWWTTGDKQGAIGEERLLRRLPFFRPQNSSEPPSPVTAQITRVNLDAPKQYLNTLSITPTDPSQHHAPPPPAVVLHGYGAGLGFFFKNFPALAHWAGLRGTSVYAVDWLGMGRSARVPFTIKAKREDIPGRVAEAESFFVDSLEQWRTKMNLEKVTLIGHSLGAYFSVVYALKYPTRVNKLILISPAGVPRDPNNTTVPSRELTDTASSNGTIGSSEPATEINIEQVRAEQAAEQRRESRTRKLFTYLWEEGWSPFQVVRSLSVFGPWVVGKYSSRRFTGLTEEETRDMHEYLLNITLAKGSGEYCISHILAPGAHARMPLVDRISALKIPVTFIYGEHDWMDPQGGSDSVENMRQAGNGEGRTYIVGRAGHHVYLDNHTAVNDLLVKELDKRHSRIN